MIEHAGKAIDALKKRPDFLVLVLLNCIVFGAVYFTLEGKRVRDHEERMVILEKCLSGK